MLESKRPDVVAFSVYLWNNIAFRELAAITRRLFPKVHIVIGGPEVATSETAEEWLTEEMADIVIRGEGESTLVDVIYRLANGDEVGSLRGTSVREGGEIVHGQPAPINRKLEDLPSPFLSGEVSIDLFARGGSRPGSARYSRVLLETYRGCYMQCAYCQWGNGDKSRSAFSESRLHRELSWFLQNDIETIFIVDAMFGYKKRAAFDLLEFIIAERKLYNANTVFNVYHNQDFYDPELFELYRAANVFIEVDIQSTNGEVLDRMGRGRWKTDSFERHLNEIRNRNVPTTGAADLIIGLPGDTLSSFEDSVDYLLQKQLKINLYQSSILPDTEWSRNAEADGIVHGPIAPRAVYENATFPLGDMVQARLIGHGTDFFNSFPRTAAVLSAGWFDRPVDLCRAIGERIFASHGLMYGESHQYDTLVGDWLAVLPTVIRDLCPDSTKSEILVELMRFEAALAAVYWAGPGRDVVASQDWAPRDAGWRNECPVFAGEMIERVEFSHNVAELVLRLDFEPDLTLLDQVEKRNNVVLFYRSAGPKYLAIDVGLTDKLLKRFNGYFTVDECLKNVGIELADMTPVWNMLSIVAECGLISPGPVRQRANLRRDANVLQSEYS